MIPISLSVRNKDLKHRAGNQFPPHFLNTAAIAQTRMSIETNKKPDHSLTTNTTDQDVPESSPPILGFREHAWYVHKFGGTSVASAACFELVAEILERQLGIVKDAQSSVDDNTAPSTTSVASPSLAIVVSAMGGKPKTTDLLLQTVQAAAVRDETTVQQLMQTVLDKHSFCLQTLFANYSDTEQRLIQMIRSDLDDIHDILKTVSLMKWQASQISELVSGYGELWSAQILTALLRQRVREREEQAENSHQQQDVMEDSSSCGIHHHEFVYIDARRFIVVDDDAIQNGGAIEWDMSQQNIDRVYREEMAKLKEKGNLHHSMTLHFVITGYVASNTDGVATTLQRDGSDYSASIVGRLLTANQINIWTDVDGILSADPRRVPQSQILSEVSFNEAMELAYFGAKVIHPKTMQPAISAKFPIPIFIKNTFNSSFRGTRIFQSGTSHTDRDKVVAGLTSIENMALINVEGSGLVGVPGVDRRIFGTMERLGFNCVLISQASSEHSVTFSVMAEEAYDAMEALKEEFARELKQNRITNIECKAPCSIIAAVGDGMALTTGVSGRFFSALGEAKINIYAIAQGSSERNISAVVAQEDSTRALRAVHAAFRLSHRIVRACIIGMNELGDSLLRLLEAQRHTLRSLFEVDLQVCVIAMNAKSTSLVKLANDNDFSADSLTIGVFNQVTGGSFLLGAPRETSFRQDENIAVEVEGNLYDVTKHLIQEGCTNHVIFDCTNDENVGKLHSEWLRTGIDVVTANNTGISGPRSQRDEIGLAQRLYGKDSAKYLNEVTVGGGLPIVNTLRNLLHSGDKIRRIDGILSVSLSYILNRISPPPNAAICSEFDEISSKGAFRDDRSMSPKSNMEECSFSQAVKEAIALGLMEEDPTKDLNNEYTARVLMVLVHELGMGKNIDFTHIQQASDKLLEFIMEEKVDYNSISPEIDAQVKERVDAAKSRGCVLRQISSVDVKNKEFEIKIVEVPGNHVFAVTPPSCECVRFFTHRHRRYPLIIQGPSAGADSTASALLAEILNLMRSKASPISVALSRSGSHASLRGTLTRGDSDTSE